MLIACLCSQLLPLLQRICQLVLKLLTHICIFLLHKIAVVKMLDNLTAGKSPKTVYHDYFCSTHFTDGIHDHLIALSVCNILLSFSASLGNILILISLHRISSLHAPSRLLFLCLATTDLCVGISEPLIVVYWISAVFENWVTCRYSLALSFFAGYMLCSVSLLTLTALSLDRLLALLLGLRYRHVVTLNRAYVLVAIIWLTAIFGASLYFCDYNFTLYYSFVGVSTCLLVSVFCYTKVFLSLRQRQIQINTSTGMKQSQVRHEIPASITRYRKAMSSAFWLQLVLVSCYLPHGISTSFYTTSSSMFFTKQCMLTLVYLNSSLNPILYCWKMKEVRKRVKGIIGQFLCTSN